MQASSVPAASLPTSPSGSNPMVSQQLVALQQVAEHSTTNSKAVQKQTKTTQQAKATPRLLRISTRPPAHPASLVLIHVRITTCAPLRIVGIPYIPRCSSGFNPHTAYRRNQCPRRSSSLRRSSGRRSDDSSDSAPPWGVPQPHDRRGQASDFDGTRRPFSIVPGMRFPFIAVALCLRLPSDSASWWTPLPSGQRFLLSGVRGT